MRVYSRGMSSALNM